MRHSYALFPVGRLSLTVRFLATGNPVEDLKFTNAITHKGYSILANPERKNADINIPGPTKGFRYL